MIPVIGLGADEHAKVAIEILRSIEDYELVGLLDPKKNLWNTKVLDVPMLGDDDLLPGLYEKGIRHTFIGLGSIGDTTPAIHPKAIVSPSARISGGLP